MALSDGASDDSLPMPSDLTLVLDIGKSNAKLLLIDTQGQVKARHIRPNRVSLYGGPGPRYGSLDIEALQAWFIETVPRLNELQAVRRISITTHGAAFCGVDEEGLVLPPVDYEWDGYGELARKHVLAVDEFAETGSPNLPLGLNAALQLHWLIENHPKACRRVQWWLPYPQYWAWWLTGEAATERSSMGCHTSLWLPQDDKPSRWSEQAGLAERFPPLRWAWEEIGTLRAGLARNLGLRSDVLVHVGSHDSNACLARYLRSNSDATVVSTGTWCVLMAAGAQVDDLDPHRDELVNVAVDGRSVPTARFMAGREYSEICRGTDPTLASEAALADVLAQGWLCLPAYTDAGGPYAGRRPSLLRHGEFVDNSLEAVPAVLRPALAALYCALLIDELVRRLDGIGATRPVILEGPLAFNPALLRALAGLLSDRPILLPQDELEGTARGAWLLSNGNFSHTQSSWTTPMHMVRSPDDVHFDPALDELLQAARQQWRHGLR